MARLLLAIVLAALLLAPAAGAVAATTSVFTEWTDKSGPWNYVTYSAGADETNRLTVSYLAGEEWVFEDPGAQIEAGQQCSGSGSRVACAPVEPAGEQLRAALGDRDDVLTVPSTLEARASLSAAGGPGADVLQATGPRGWPGAELDGGPGDDTLGTTRGGELWGGEGSDELRATGGSAALDGGTGADRLLGGQGDDELNPGLDADPDLIDGGAGRDHLSYYRAQPSEARPLTIDMEAMTAAPGDTLRSIESVSGGHGPDVLRGSDRRDWLDGGYGADRVEGRAGDDTLEGGDEDDRVDGGAGDDVVRGGDEIDHLSGGPGDDVVDPWTGNFEDAVERISCGSGRDTVPVPDTYDDVPARLRFLPRDCELVDVRASMLDRFRARPEIAAGSARWSLMCERPVWRGRCPARLDLRAGGRGLGSGSIDLRRRERGTVSVRLNEAGRRLARRGGRVEVVVRLQSGPGGFGAALPRRYSVDLPPRG